MRMLGALLAAALFWPGAVRAIEKVGPEETHRRETAEVDEFSLKPARIYSHRGRRDPFVPARFGVTQTARPETSEFTISKLEFTGYLSMGGRAIGLFNLKDSNLTYTLRGGKLYGPGDEVVSQVRGRILENQDIELRQGERQLVFRKHGRDR